LLILPFWCPNQGLIRTRIAHFSLFMSESGAHSDTDCSFLPFGVRIKGSFGHELLIFAFWCPNQGLIRTRIAHFCLWVSESRAHSDTDCSFLPLGVRIKGSFGHGLLIFAFWCPNQGLIRTRIAHFCLWVCVRIKGSFGHGLLIFAFGCPNQGLIRTRIAHFCLWVSESRAHSDTDCSFCLWVSESRAHSDTDCSFLPLGVRMRP
jgi:hypothetical protein